VLQVKAKSLKKILLEHVRPLEEAMLALRNEAYDLQEEVRMWENEVGPHSAEVGRDHCIAEDILFAAHHCRCAVTILVDRIRDLERVKNIFEPGERLSSQILYPDDQKKNPEGQS
jgi:hypothetical protein